MEPFRDRYVCVCVMNEFVENEFVLAVCCQASRVVVVVVSLTQPVDIAFQNAQQSVFNGEWATYLACLAHEVQHK